MAEELKENDNHKNLEETARENFVTIHVNDFTEEVTKSFYEEFAKAQGSGQSFLPIFIDSYGGECYSLLAMLDLVKSSKIPVATITLGKAMSCGADLLAAGTKGMRYASPYSSILVHQTANMAIGKLADLKIEVKETERIDTLLMHILDENCGKKKGYFNKIFKRNLNTDLYLTAKQAKKHGLVDHVKVPSIKTIVTSKTKIS